MNTIRNIQTESGDEKEKVPSTVLPISKPKVSAHSDSTMKATNENVDTIMEMSVITMDMSYFSNPDYVRVDLQAFCDAWNHAQGEAGKAIDITDMVPHKKPSSATEIVAASGEQITWGLYVKSACNAIAGKERTDACKYTSLAQTVRSMKQLIGIEFAEYPPMDQAYFSNPDYVRADIQAFCTVWNALQSESAKHIGVGVMDTSRPGKSTSIVATNGEKITWSGYLLRCSSAFTGRSSANTWKEMSFTDVLLYFKRFLGVVVMDKNYFHNPNCVRTDLQAFCDAWNAQLKPGEERIDSGSMTSTTPSESTKAVTFSGELISWQAYQQRCRMSLTGKAKKAAQQEMSRSHVLKHLKKLSGKTLMDIEYFNNAAYVRRDLQAFCDIWNQTQMDPAKHIGIADMTTQKRPVHSTQINTFSGESVSWQAYLRRGSTAITGKVSREAAQEISSSSVLSYLKHLALSTEKQDSWIDEL